VATPPRANIIGLMFATGNVGPGHAVVVNEVNHQAVPRGAGNETTRQAIPCQASGIGQRTVKPSTGQVDGRPGDRSAPIVGASVSAGAFTANAVHLLLAVNNRLKTTYFTTQRTPNAETLTPRTMAVLVL
jgi:hypothetical protein